MVGRTPDVFVWDDFRLDLDRYRLERAGDVLALEPKALDLLALLVSRPGHLFGKQEIFDTLWPDTAVTDSALTRVIAQLRRVLADDPRDPRFIETVPTRGYRWKCQVRVEPRQEVTVDVASNGAAPPHAAGTLDGTDLTADATSALATDVVARPTTTGSSAVCRQRRGRPATAGGAPERLAGGRNGNRARADGGGGVDELTAGPAAGHGRDRNRRGSCPLAGAGDDPPRPRHGPGVLAPRRCAGVRLGPQRRARDLRALAR